MYTLQYPPAHNSTYVKATTETSQYEAPIATDPTKSLIGAQYTNQWFAAHLAITNQRFHIDLGSAKTIRKILYANSHDSGGLIDRGVKDFTFWGSNIASAFQNLNYNADTDWVQIAVSQSYFDQHVASDIADLKYIIVTNNTPYRYYAFKFANNYGSTEFIGVRRISLMTRNPANNFSGGGAIWIF